MPSDAGEPTWLRPLFVNGGGATIEVGIELEARPTWWVRGGADKVAPRDDRRLLLPLMQAGYGGNYETARRMVEVRLIEAKLDADLAATFPFEAPVLGADIARSAFWQEQAESWRPHVRAKYAAAGLSAQFDRLYRGNASGLPLPPGRAERDQLFREVWRSLGADGSFPTWSSGRVDAAVHWSMNAGLVGVRGLWRAWFMLLCEVEPNILHWNLMDQLWISAHYTGFTTDLVDRPPGEVHGPLSTAQALLVLRFLPLEGELGRRLRAQLSGLSLTQEVDGKRFSTRMPLESMFL